MKTNDFISDIGDMLGEDFSRAPTWTRVELLGYLRKTIRRFSELALIIDEDSLRYVSSTTGEANVPASFVNAYYNSYDKTFIDMVQLGELDFVSGTWSLGTTGVSPLACTVMGGGKDAIIRVVPVPVGAIGPFGLGVITEVTLADSSGAFWDVTVDTSGVLSTTANLTGTSMTLVLNAPTTHWDLTVDTVGVLSTVASSSVTSQSVILLDANGMHWSVTTDDVGVLLTGSGYGKLVRLEIDGVNQDFTSNYGTVTDAYAYGSTTTPSYVARLDGPFGVVTMGRVSDGALHTWYKGLISDTLNTESEIYLNDCFIPVIQHGVLALAYGAETSGCDSNKEKLLDAIFVAECTSVRRIFNRK